MRIVRTAACLLVVASTVISAQADDVMVEGRGEGERLHRMGADESLSDVAARFLGGKEYVPELLKYNGVENPLTVKPGFLLAIPGRTRAEALLSLDCAEKAVVIAIDQGAERFAIEELKQARQTLAGARAAWGVTAYSKAKSLGMLTIQRASEAASLAAERAEIGLQYRVSSVHRDVSFKATDAAEWIVAEVGTVLGAGASIRTGSGARAELTAEDGSRIQVRADTEVTLREIVRDRRTSRTTTRLKLLLGEILGTIEKQPTDDSKFEIESGHSSTAIRGTSLQVAQQARTTRVMVHEGEVAVAGPGWIQALKQDMGLAMVGRSRPRATPLPLAPALDSPAGDGVTTASQSVLFTWCRTGTREFAAQNRLPLLSHRARSRLTYRFELAADEGFNAVVMDEKLRGTCLKSCVLPPGVYYWRVSSVNAYGLEGTPSAPRQLTIQRELGVRIVPSVAPVNQGTRLVFGPHTRFGIEPAAPDTSVVAFETGLGAAALLPGGGRYLPVRGHRGLRAQRAGRGLGR